MIARAARLEGLEVTLNDLATGLRSKAFVAQQELHSANGVIALNNSLATPVAGRATCSA